MKVNGTAPLLKPALELPSGLAEVGDLGEAELGVEAQARRIGGINAGDGARHQGGEGNAQPAAKPSQQRCGGTRKSKQAIRPRGRWPGSGRPRRRDAPIARQGGRWPAAFARWRLRWSPRPW